MEETHEQTRRNNPSFEERGFRAKPVAQRFENNNERRKRMNFLTKVFACVLFLTILGGALILTFVQTVQNVNFGG